jgi:hypothetical protein
MAKVQLSAQPAELGFINSVRRQDVPLNAMTGPSLDWLVGRRKLKRRKGSVLVKDGTLETKWGALARRIIAAALGTVADGYRAPLILYRNDAIKAGTLCWRSTNVSPAEWRTVGQEFSAHHYPSTSTGVPNHRVLPRVYRNQYGGLTLHRLNTAEYRAHMAAGSRNPLQVGKQVCWGGFDSEPAQWDGGFNHDDSTDVPYSVRPLGLIPPLQMPICTPGTDLGTSVKGPFIGTSAFFYSVLFENDKGELSMFTIPRPPGSAWSGYPGFGYMQVDSANATHFFDSVIFSFIPEGPAGTRWKWLLISDVVDTATTGAGALVQPSIGNLALLDKIPQGQTTYVCTNSNTLGLGTDTRIADMVKGLLQWAPCAKDVGRFDGHTTLGNLRPNPNALILAPWLNGNRNKQVDDADLYGATSYFAAVTQSSLVLRSVTGGSASDTTVSIAGMTLRELVDQLNADGSLATTAITACGITANQSLIVRATAFTGVFVGDTVVSARFPTGTKVTRIFPLTLGVYALGMSNKAVTSGVALPTGESVDFVHRTAGTAMPWAAGVVPGADADESTDSLLRTYVSATATYGTTDTTLAVSASDASYITPGMLVVDTDFTAGTVVTAVSGTTVTVSPASIAHAHTGTDIVFAYDTGDTTLGLLPGFVRGIGNCAPILCKWNMAYLSRFDDSPQDSVFSAASPGYAQDALNTWKVNNRRYSPTGFGELMGMADLGPVEIQFNAEGRMSLLNTRTGTTHNDEDYTKHATSWNRGSVCPYAICAGNGWAIAPTAEGFMVCDAGQGEAFISGAIYDPEADEGERGELEYALEACVAASQSGSDSYKMSAEVINGVLYVHYFASAESTYFDREIRYDFSASVGRSGISEVLRADGSPYPWSAPLTLRGSCSVKMAQADGKVHRFAAIDANTHATLDGYVRELDKGATDSTVRVRPVAYTGLRIPDDLSKLQPTMAHAISTKAGTGLEVALTREPERDPTLATWDVLELDTSGADEFVRSVPWLEPAASEKRIAITARISDDGSGDGAEISRILIDCEERASVEK